MAKETNTTKASGNNKPKENVPEQKAPEQKAPAAETKVKDYEKKAQELMKQHGLDEVFVSKDGYFFTDENNARNHDKEFQTIKKSV